MSLFKISIIINFFLPGNQVLSNILSMYHDFSFISMHTYVLFQTHSTHTAGRRKCKPCYMFCLQLCMCGSALIALTKLCCSLKLYVYYIVASQSDIYSYSQPITPTTPVHSSVFSEGYLSTTLDRPSKKQMQTDEPKAIESSLCEYI